MSRYGINSNHHKSDFAAASNRFPDFPVIRPELSSTHLAMTRPGPLAAVVANGINLCRNRDSRKKDWKVQGQMGMKKDASLTKVIMTTKHQYNNKWMKKYLICSILVSQSAS